MTENTSFNFPFSKRGITLCTAILLSLNVLPAFAFPDIYEPDDSPEEANIAVIGDETPKQHTLHQTDDGERDEDWFKFSLQKNGDYDIKVISVGKDIDVALELYDSPDAEEPIEDGEADGGDIGKEEILRAFKLKEGTYYLKVYDAAAKPTECGTETQDDDEKSADCCRTDIQYDLHVVRRGAVKSGTIEGIVMDAISGNLIENAVISTTCNSNDTTFSDQQGIYSLTTTCPQGDIEALTAKVTGYKPLTCRIALTEILSKREDMPLLPEGQNLPAPSISRNGNNLRMELPTLFAGCLNYYVGMQYPDGRFLILTKTAKTINDMQPFGNFLPRWEGLGNVAIDNMLITDDMPPGTYTFYLLRTPEGTDNPLEQLEELTVTTFELK